MNYEEFKAAVAQQGITPESHAVQTRDGIESVIAERGDPADWLEIRFDTIEDLLLYDPRASDEDIHRTQDALGVSLPADYICFLKEFGGADGLRARWGSVASAHWIKGQSKQVRELSEEMGMSSAGENDWHCDLVNEQENWGLEGRFVRIGEDFSDYEEAFDLEAGHFGFLVEDGVCQSQVRWLDHEYDGYEDLESCSREVGDVLSFLFDVLKSDLSQGHVDGAKCESGDSLEVNLLKAATCGDISAVRQMLDAGVNIEAETIKKETALLQAVAPGHTEVIKLLLERGANVEAEDEDSDTALIRAAYWGRLETLQLLMEHGADINHKDDAGYTSLIVAAWQGHPEIVQLLIERGAKVNERNGVGQTAISISATEEIRHILLKAGAKPMDYDEFKVILAEHGIVPGKSTIETAIESIARSSTEALQHFTGFSSSEEVFANMSKDELTTLVKSLCKQGDTERWQYSYQPPWRYLLQKGFSDVEAFLQHDARASDEDIRKAEEAFGASLPADFVRFHKEFGAPLWGGFDAYEFNGEYKVRTTASEMWWADFYDMKWGEESGDDEWDWKGRFVKIGEFSEDDYGLDTGHFGFLVKDGVCQREVVCLNHDYADSEDLESGADVVDDILGFLLGEVIHQYRKVC